MDYRYSRDLINQHFPKGDIMKGNVGTFWQDVVFSTLKVYEPALYKNIQGLDTGEIPSFKSRGKRQPDI